MKTDGYDVQYYDRVTADGRTLRGAKVTDLQRGGTMNRTKQLSEADFAGYYCLLEPLHRLGLLGGIHGPIAITDPEMALAFMAGVRARLDELSELCRESQQTGETR